MHDFVCTFRHKRRNASGALHSSADIKHGFVRAFRRNRRVASSGVFHSSADTKHGFVPLDVAAGLYHPEHSSSHLHAW